MQRTITSTPKSQYLPVPRGWIILGLCLLAWALFLPALVMIKATITPCATEDSSFCRWDAQTQGNGQGRSFVDIAGQVIYLP